MSDITSLSDSTPRVFAGIHALHVVTPRETVTGGEEGLEQHERPLIDQGTVDWPRIMAEALTGRAGTQTCVTRLQGV